jgi:glutaminase
VFGVGDWRTPFSVQSISKVFTLALTLARDGDAVWKRVGKEPSGNPFNSLVQLEYEQGVPRNPFINAGALVITERLLSLAGDARRAAATGAQAAAFRVPFSHSTVRWTPSV